MFFPFFWHFWYFGLWLIFFWFIFFIPYLLFPFLCYFFFLFPSFYFFIYFISFTLPFSNFSICIQLAYMTEYQLQCTLRQQWKSILEYLYLINEKDSIIIPFPIGATRKSVRLWMSLKLSALEGLFIFVSNFLNWHYLREFGS